MLYSVELRSRNVIANSLVCECKDSAFFLCGKIFFEKNTKWAVSAPELVCIDLADAMNRVRTGRAILGHKKTPRKSVTSGELE